eukprot:TRINITY_DN6671_c4_g1_i1.p1 TRINITY_DN6671_c4_g1~~TRINITY_DN6671_c4_g1_i1.p1  ORF type:complete len:299 (-),score=69.57 TRINITY_DN6671_c4_g1_i1:524-1420(-)
MPSGSKKRKAAKKKKEQGTNLDSPTNSQGNVGEKVDDQMSHDGKESDNSDADSPTSQECSTQFYLVEEKRDSSQLGVEKPMEGSGNGDSEGRGVGFSTKTEEVVVVDRELEGEGDGVLSSATEDSKIVNIDIDQVQSEKGSQDDSSDENESSEDESRLIGDTAEKELEKSSSGPPIEPVEQSASFSKEVTLGIEESNSSPLIKPVGQSSSFSEEVTQVIDDPVENYVSSLVVDLPFNEKEESVKPSLETQTEKSIDDGECSKVSHNPENEPQIALALERPSSWKSCCGLFDVLTGSHR